jgi:hypothetical protein
MYIHGQVKGESDEKSSRSGGGSRKRNRHLSGLASGVCGSVKALWLLTVGQFVHPSGATILGALRFGVRRVPLQHRPLDTIHALICRLGAAGHDLPCCLAPLVGSPNIFPSATMLRDCDAHCAGLALEASCAFQGLRRVFFWILSRFGPGVEMCELSELSPGRQLSPAMGNSSFPEVIASGQGALQIPPLRSSGAPVGMTTGGVPGKLRLGRVEFRRESDLISL